MAEKTTGKVKAHTIYKKTDGTRVPGVTTILGVLNKPALVPWANRMGLQGIDTTKYVDEKASIGTLAHEMIMAHICDEEVDFSDYTPNQIELAENSILKYFDWEKEHLMTPIMVESPMVSEIMGYGGQIDLLCELDGVPTLVDFKTGGGIYKEMGYQLAAYTQLINESTGYALESGRILRIGRSEDEGFEERVYPNLGAYFEVFEHCLQIYQLQKLCK